MASLRRAFPLVFSILVLTLPPFCRRHLPGARPPPPDHADGLYQPGEKATWTVEVANPDPAFRAGLTAAPYSVTRDGADTVASGSVDLSSGSAMIAASRDEPGALLVRVGGDTRKPLALGGAVFGAEKIGPALPAPADFDSFWQAELAALAQVPMNPVLEKVDGLPGSAGLEYDKVTLDNIGGTKVRGQLAKPAKEGKFPAILMLHAAGVYPLNKGQVLGQARSGWLALDILAHDLPIDETDAFYLEQKNGALKDYPEIGCEDRETSYFLRMFWAASGPRITWPRARTGTERS